MTTFPLSTLAGIIWDSGAASIRLCHVLVELGMTKPNSKCQSSIILPLNRTFCSIRNFSIGSWLEKLISLENVKDSIITISSWNESSQWANSPKPLRFDDYFFFSWNESGQCGNRQKQPKTVAFSRIFSTKKKMQFFYRKFKNPILSDNWSKVDIIKAVIDDVIDKN